MNEEELLRQIKRLNTGIDGISDELVAAIEKYQRNYERALYKVNFDIKDGYIKTNLSNYSKATSIDGMNKLGFRQLAIDHISEYNSVANKQIIFAQSLGIATDLSFKDLEILKKLQELDLAALYSQGEALDNAIKKALVNGIASGSNYDDMIGNISDTLLGAGETTGMLAKYADTYLRTSLFGLSRMVDKEIYEKAGGYSKYLYVGPIDKRTREFCIEHVGNSYTEAEIEQFPNENDSGLDPWFSPGGWNCRHRLIPVDSID